MQDFVHQPYGLKDPIVNALLTHRVSLYIYIHTHIYTPRNKRKHHPTPEKVPITKASGTCMKNLKQIYVYIYICMYACVYIYTYVYIYICIINIYIYMCICLYMHTCAFPHIYIYMCVHIIYIYTVCIHIYMY